MNTPKIKTKASRTLTWRGVNGDFHDPRKWGGVTPQSGDNLVFPPTPNDCESVDLSGLTLNSITVHRGASINIAKGIYPPVSMNG